MICTAEDVFNTMNLLQEKGCPFFFMIDYEIKKGICLEMKELQEAGIYYETAQSRIVPTKDLLNNESFQFRTFPESYDSYLLKFNRIQQEIQKGNTYLINLCCKSKVETNYSLENIFYSGKAKSRLYIKDQLVCFSPEPFVTIRDDNRIESCPMKGTINANQQNAAMILLEDEKEISEQYTITDLIRNDLSEVATSVRVEKFRYLEKIHGFKNDLLQTSSDIRGMIKKEYQNKPGDLMRKLLPAGSICGAPKRKTLAIIQEVEGFERNFYTGIWGISTPQGLESYVMIRMLEKQGDTFYFKSGGGITSHSQPRKEYEEMKEKIYVPVL